MSLTVCTETQIPQILEMLLLIKLQAGNNLLSVSGSWGPVFWRYLLNRKIDQDDTLPQEVLVCDLIFHNILL